MFTPRRKSTVPNQPDCMFRGDAKKLEEPRVNLNRNRRNLWNATQTGRERNEKVESDLIL